jgi:uncharacterized protein (TIGR02284 family)
MDDETRKHLESLHTAAIDARHGYEEAASDAKGGGLTPLFHQMIALHARNEAELAGALGSGAVAADDDGSFMSIVHRTIIGLRSLFGGLDESILPGLIDGEERNIAHYDKALEEATIPAEIRALLVAQRGRLESAVAHMRSGEA